MAKFELLIKVRSKGINRLKGAYMLLRMAIRIGLKLFMQLKIPAFRMRSTFHNGLAQPLTPTGSLYLERWNSIA
jgi:hypothetical protein